eukprot:PhM_4_TR1410/c0_g1_i1/m.15244
MVSTDVFAPVTCITQLVGKGGEKNKCDIFVAACGTGVLRITKTNDDSHNSGDDDVVWLPLEPFQGSTVHGVVGCRSVDDETTSSSGDFYAFGRNVVARCRLDLASAASADITITAVHTINTFDGRWILDVAPSGTSVDSGGCVRTLRMTPAVVAVPSEVHLGILSTAAIGDDGRGHGSSVAALGSFMGEIALVFIDHKTGASTTRRCGEGTHPSRIVRLRLAAQCRVMLSTSDDRTAVVWHRDATDAHCFVPHQRLQNGHVSRIWDVICLSHGAVLSSYATAGEDGAVVVWSSAGTIVRRVTPHTGHGTLSLCEASLRDACVLSGGFDGGVACTTLRPETDDCVDYTIPSGTVRVIALCAATRRVVVATSRGDILFRQYRDTENACQWDIAHCVVTDKTAAREIQVSALELVPGTNFALAGDTTGRLHGVALVSPSTSTYCVCDGVVPIKVSLIEVIPNEKKALVVNPFGVVAIVCLAKMLMKGGGTCDLRVLKTVNLAQKICVTSAYLASTTASTSSTSSLFVSNKKGSVEIFQISDNNDNDTVADISCAQRFNSVHENKINRFESNNRHGYDEVTSCGSDGVIGVFRYVASTSSWQHVSSVQMGHIVTNVLSSAAGPVACGVHGADTVFFNMATSSMYGRATLTTARRSLKWDVSANGDATVACSVNNSDVRIVHLAGGDGRPVRYLREGVHGHDIHDVVCCRVSSSSSSSGSPSFSICAVSEDTTVSLLQYNAGTRRASLVSKMHAHGSGVRVACSAESWLFTGGGQETIVAWEYNNDQKDAILLPVSITRPYGHRHTEADSFLPRIMGMCAFSSASPSSSNISVFAAVSSGHLIGYDFNPAEVEPSRKFRKACDIDVSGEGPQFCAHGVVVEGEEMFVAVGAGSGRVLAFHGGQPSATSSMQVVAISRNNVGHHVTHNVPINCVQCLAQSGSSGQKTKDVLICCGGEDGVVELQRWCLSSDNASITSVWLHTPQIPVAVRSVKFSSSSCCCGVSVLWASRATMEYSSEKEKFDGSDTKKTSVSAPFSASRPLLLAQHETNNNKKDDDDDDALLVVYVGQGLEFNTKTVMSFLA